MRKGTKLALAALALASCATAPATGGSPSGRPTPSASAPAIVLHWMSYSAHSEPHYQLLYEGGEVTPFSELRLMGPDGTIVSTGPAVPSANETMRLCGGGRSGPTAYGPIRVTLILPTQAALGDVIARPDAYRVEVRVNSTWVKVGLINECHGQE
jgi:hypothetical protein